MQVQPGTGPGEITALLRVARDGDRGAFDRLFGLVYEELRAVAERQVRREHGAVGTTELVHELYLKLVDQPGVEVVGRAHFYAVAGRAMRQILVDLARRRGATKRGGDQVRASLSGLQLAVDARFDDVIALDELLDRLDERQRRVVEMRFFAGLQEHEVAEALGVSVRTVQREWTKARAWLYRQLYTEASGGDAGPS
jgi:RNA polymerase sigma factor (TIGR02999 family)